MTDEQRSAIVALAKLGAKQLGLEVDVIFEEVKDVHQDKQAK